jgi:hypothetical protein
MGQFFRACLNRKTLDKLLGRDRSFFSSFSRQSKHVDPTLQDCEDALIPIIDYLERNLKILNDNLSDTNMQLVVIRIWREILITLEGVLLPPLSEQLSDWKPLDDYEFHVVYKWLEVKDTQKISYHCYILKRRPFSSSKSYSMVVKMKMPLPLISLKTHTTMPCSPSMQPITWRPKS